MPRIILQRAMPQTNGFSIQIIYLQTNNNLLANNLYEDMMILFIKPEIQFHGCSILLSYEK